MGLPAAVVVGVVTRSTGRKSRSYLMLNSSTKSMLSVNEQTNKQTNKRERECDADVDWCQYNDRVDGEQRRGDCSVDVGMSGWYKRRCTHQYW